jgi:hypothetical protein
MQPYIDQSNKDKERYEAEKLAFDVCLFFAVVIYMRHSDLLTHRVARQKRSRKSPRAVRRKVTRKTTSKRTSQASSLHLVCGWYPSNSRTKSVRGVQLNYHYASFLCTVLMSLNCALPSFRLNHRRSFASSSC